MKFQKLLLRTLFGCLLVGASGAAMAKGPKNDCPQGVVLGEVLIGDLVVKNKDCLIQDAIVMGNVRVDNKGKPGVIFIMRDVVVNGEVTVKGASAVIAQTVVVENLSVEETVLETVVTETLILGPGDMVFKDNQQVLIYHNVVQDGDIQCVGNINPFTDPVGAVAVDNVVYNGNITCFGQ